MIPWPFIRERVRLSWAEAAFGYHNQWLSWRGAVELALDCLREGEVDILIVRLAGCSKSEAHCVGDLLDKIALLSERADASLAKDKWLYLNLAWLLENGEAVADALDKVEAMYADFGYPEEVAAFVRYMPADGAGNVEPGSYEENISRLIEKWKIYIGRKAELYRI